MPQKKTTSLLAHNVKEKRIKVLFIRTPRMTVQSTASLGCYFIIKNSIPLYYIVLELNIPLLMSVSVE